MANKQTSSNVHAKSRRSGSGNNEYVDPRGALGSVKTLNTDVFNSHVERLDKGPTAKCKGESSKEK